GADRWIASVAGISGITVQDWDARVDSVVCRGCTLPDPLAEPLRPSASGDDTDVSPYAGVSLELMTPELPTFGSPRFFLGGEIAGSFGSKRKVAQEGDPGKVGSPAPEGAQDTTPFGDDVALGQGSQTIGEMAEVMYGVYAGVAFPFEFRGRALRIKPAIAWMRYEVDIEGLVVDADCRPVIGTTECNTNLGGFLRETRLGASSTEDFDGIGPGLDIEMDTGRVGPISTSVFAGARFYRILGDRKIKLTAGPEAFDDVLGQDEAAARYEFEVDEWMYRFGLGVRLQWLGFDD
ncbi:MAG: hypothetical protein JRF61_02590, partial [Deltaproteobacteria bacterium]|nr:hypothetical protein [Deltaproteobacteria bacterium]